MGVDISQAVKQLLEARRSGVQVKPPFAIPDRAPDAVNCCRKLLSADSTWRPRSASVSHTVNCIRAKLVDICPPSQ